MSGHGLDEESEPASHVEQTSGAPGHEPFEEIAMHSRPGFAPVKLVTAGHLVAPKARVVRIGFIRRENVEALPASENVDTELGENGTMLDASA
jgi:hypothetical protein